MTNTPSLSVVVCLLAMATAGCFSTVVRTVRLAPSTGRATFTTLDGRPLETPADAEVTAVLTGGSTHRFRRSSAALEGGTLVVRSDARSVICGLDGCAWRLAEAGGGGDERIRLANIDHFQLALSRQDGGLTALAVVGVIVGLLAVGLTVAMVVGLEHLPGR